MTDTWNPHKHRTANDGITFEGEATGLGGGGSGGVQVVTVPVSSAEILALHDTPVVLIPGVPGSVIVVTAASIVYVAGATPYTDNGGRLSMGVPPATEQWAGVNGAGFWDQAASQVFAQPYGEAVLIGAALSAWDGVDVSVYEDTANPTLGDGTLLVTLSYFLAPTV